VNKYKQGFPALKPRAKSLKMPENRIVMPTELVPHKNRIWFRSSALSFQHFNGQTLQSERQRDGDLET
jgi:hypothetical protein